MLPPSIAVLVGRVGVEPTQCLHRGILSPLRLPIPPPPHVASILLFHGYRSRGNLIIIRENVGGIFWDLWIYTIRHNESKNARMVKISAV
jgi:hypothetical protein